MKTLKNLCVIIAIVLFSCNTADDLTIDLKELETDPDKEEIFGNNPFVQIGSVYQKMQTTYKLQNDLKLKDIYKQLNKTLLEHGIVITPSNCKSNPAEIPSDLASDKAPLLDLIENSALNEPAKTSLYEFMKDLVDYNGDNYDFVLRQLYNYELETIHNKHLTSYDRQVILSFTTLVMNSHGHKNAYMQQANEDEDGDELEDQDWDITVGETCMYLNISLSETVHEMAQAMYKSFKGL